MNCKDKNKCKYIFVTPEDLDGKYSLLSAVIVIIIWV
jgi:hypothetical protein